MKRSHILLLFVFTFFMISCKSDPEDSKKNAEDSEVVSDAVVIDTVTKKKVVISKEERIKQANSLWSKLISDPENMAFIRNLVTSGTAEILINQNGPFTVMAPSNAAFSKLTGDQVEYFSNPRNMEELIALMKRHILVGAFDSVNLHENVDKGKGVFEVMTLAGDKLKISKKGKGLVVSSEKGSKGAIVKSDITASNGVIHVLDALILD